MKKQRCTGADTSGTTGSLWTETPTNAPEGTKTVPTQPHPPTPTRRPRPRQAQQRNLHGTVENFPSTTVNNVPLTRENIAVWWHLVKPVTLSEPQTYGEYSDYAESPRISSTTTSPMTIAWRKILHTEPQIDARATAEQNFPKILSFTADIPIR